MARYTKIGVIGSGKIGGNILSHIHADGELKLTFVLDPVADPANWDGVPAEIFVTDAEAALERPVDLVIEAAMPKVLAELAPRFLQSAAFCGFSCTTFADPAIEQAVRGACEKSGHVFFVPHGAMLALDGIGDGRALLDNVTITPTKSGPSLRLDADASGLLFEGSTRNVNVHATIALAGIGFDKTVSRVIAAPGQETMEHHVEVSGTGLHWDLKISSRSLGGVTGAYTPHSAIGSIRRLLGGNGIVVA